MQNGVMVSWWCSRGVLGRNSHLGVPRWRVQGPLLVGLHLGTQQRACVLMRASNQPTGPSLSVSGFKGMGGCVKRWFHF